jgi:hypothetical protein
MNSDILLFAETWTLPREKYYLQTFEEVARVDCPSNRLAFGTSAYVKKSYLKLLGKINTHQIIEENGHVEGISFQIGDLNISVAYASPKCKFSSIKQFITKVCKPSAKQLLFADFNLNLNTNEGDLVRNLLSIYELRSMLPLTISTTNAKTQIDIAFSNLTEVKAGVYESTHSHHKPLWLQLEKPTAQQESKDLQT